MLEPELSGTRDQLGSSKVPKLIRGIYSGEYGLQERPAEPECEDAEASGQAIVGWSGQGVVARGMGTVYEIWKDASAAHCVS